MEAYLRAIRSGQGALVSRTKGSAVQTVLERAKEKFPEYKDVRSPEVPGDELEAYVRSMVDEEVDNYFAPMTTALGEVALYGSEKAYEACSALLTAMRDEGPDAIRDALGDLIAVCRKELGMPPLTKR